MLWNGFVPLYFGCKVINLNEFFFFFLVLKLSRGQSNICGNYPWNICTVNTETQWSSKTKKNKTKYRLGKLTCGKYHHHLNKLCVWIKQEQHWREKQCGGKWEKKTGQCFQWRGETPQALFSFLFLKKCGLYLKLKSGCEVLLLFSEVEQVLFKKKKDDRNTFRGQAAALTAFCLHVGDGREKKYI